MQTIVGELAMSASRATRSMRSRDGDEKHVVPEDVVNRKRMILKQFGQ